MAKSKLLNLADVLMADSLLEPERRAQLRRKQSTSKSLAEARQGILAALEHMPEEDRTDYHRNAATLLIWGALAPLDREPFLRQRGLSDEDVAHLRQEVLLQCAARQESDRMAARARREQLKRRAAATHYIVLDGDSQEAEGPFRTSTEAQRAAVARWEALRRPQGVFKYRDDWPEQRSGGVKAGYRQTVSYFACTVITAEILAAAYDGTPAPGVDPNKEVQVGAMMSTSGQATTESPCWADPRIHHAGAR